MTLTLALILTLLGGHLYPIQDWCHVHEFHNPGLIQCTSQQAVDLGLDGSIEPCGDSMDEFVYNVEVRVRVRVVETLWTSLYTMWRKHQDITQTNSQTRPEQHTNGTNVADLDLDLDLRSYKPLPVAF